MSSSVALRIEGSSEDMLGLSQNLGAEVSAKIKITRKHPQPNWANWDIAPSPK